MIYPFLNKQNMMSLSLWAGRIVAADKVSGSQLLSSSADLFQNILSGTLSVSECQTVSLDPDQVRHSVCSDLGPNCLQRLSGDNTSCHW